MAIDIKRETLDKISHEASENVAKAFTKLAGQPVSLKEASSDLIPLNKIFEILEPLEQEAVVVYTQIISGTADGVGMLIMSRENALALVDILNQQPLGTTGILKDMDRSAIKETLNILANVYMTVLAKNLQMILVSSVPNMATSARMRDMINPILQKGAGAGDVVVFFDTALVLGDHKLGVNVYLIFNEELANLLK